MSIFENMDAREIAMCLSAFYEDAKEWKRPRVKLMSTQVRLPNRDQPITLFRSDCDEGIKILREDYDVFWTPNTKPDDLKRKINKRRMKELDEHIRKNTYIDTDSVYGRMAFGPGCVVMGNDYLYRRELGLPDNATVADILEKIRRLMDESCILNSKVLKLEDADRLRRHWHSKYEEEHKECVRLSKLHAANKENKDKQDATIRDLSNQNTTLEYSVAALKKRIRNLETGAAGKETKTKVITDTLRDNLVDSIEECKKLNGRIRLLEDQLKVNGVPPLEDPLDPGF